MKIRNFNCFVTTLILLMLSTIIVSATINGEEPSLYKIVWDSPSKNVYGTMPIGNGEVALNAWIDEVGDLKFYIARIDSLDEFARILKLGSVRIRIGESDKKRTAENFRQVLDIKRGVLEASYGNGDEKVSLRFWVDANRPVIVVEITAGKPVTATAFGEIWRTKQEKIPPSEVSDIYRGSKFEMIVEPDVVLENLKTEIGWYHRNIHDTAYKYCAELQGLDDFPRENPLLHRTFGTLIRCEHPNRIDDLTLQSTEGRTHRFEIVANTKHPATVDEWLAETTNILDSAQKISIDERKQKHESWWQDFFNRSWIHITQNDKQVDTKNDSTQNNSDTFILSRAYTLQRYVSACAGRGRYPIKFNGSLFTVPEKDRAGDADYRRWGSGYWFQNTRLPYMSMPAAGDVDMMQPFFQMYFDLLPLCKFRTKKYLGQEGVYLPECVYVWGDAFPLHYGFTPFAKRKTPTERLEQNSYVIRYWTSGLELSTMMLEYYEYTEDKNFLKEKAIPFAMELLTFFDQRFTVGGNGKYIMSPAQALETWHDCDESAAEIAGLRYVCERLEQLAGDELTAGNKKFLNAIKQKLPELPITNSPDGKPMFAPAKRFARKSNVENVELYSVYPFRLISYNSPNVDLAIEAFKHRQDRGAFGWRQDDLFAAYLGLTDEAKTHLVKRARTKHAPSRFPVFWGPNYDWIPDQDHGGILCKGIQSLIMQCDGKRIDLFPAFPTDWDCDFKLNAPYKTTIEGQLKNGKLINLKVTPKEREKDVIYRSR